MLPVILAASGSDPSGGAGLQADLPAIAAAGGYATGAVTALTVQNSRGMRSAHPVDPGLVAAQMEAVLEDMPVAAVKTGMLPTPGGVRAVASVLGRHPGPILVVDPVLGPTAGADRFPPATGKAILEHLAGRAALVTPNAGEAALFTGRAVRTPDDAERAGQALLQEGAGGVLVKGGHLDEDPGTDVLVTAEGTWRFPGAWQETSGTHGSGCVLAAVVATFLGRGMPLPEAVLQGKEFTARAIRHGIRTGSGRAAVDPLFAWRGNRWHG